MQTQEASMHEPYPCFVTPARHGCLTHAAVARSQLGSGLLKLLHTQVIQSTHPGPLSARMEHDPLQGPVKVEHTSACAHLLQDMPKCLCKLTACNANSAMKLCCTDLHACVGCCLRIKSRIRPHRWHLPPRAPQSPPPPSSASSWGPGFCRASQQQSWIWCCMR